MFVILSEAKDLLSACSIQQRESSKKFTNG